MSLCNLLYINTNPHPETVCDRCASLIGTVWIPGTEPVLPMHPSCYCAYVPTELAPTDGVQPPDIATLPPRIRREWIAYLVYLLLIGRRISTWLRPLLPEAEQAYRDKYGKNPDKEPYPQPQPPKENSPMPDTPAAPVTVRAPGLVHLSPDDTQPSAHRVYRCTFIAAGRVKRSDQQPSNWLIPAHAIQAATPLFSAVPSYLDHAAYFGFGSRQEPHVADLVGVTFEPQWSAEDQALMGNLSLYDRAQGSPGWLVGTLFDQILEDQAAGKPVPPVGLSAVFYHESHLDETSGLRITDTISHVESLDIVYDPGAAGYIKAALSAVRPSVHFLPNLDPTEEDPMSEETTPYITASDPVPDVAPTPPAPAPDTLAPEPAPEDPTPDPALADALARIEAMSQQVQRLTTLLAHQQDGTVITGMQSPSAPVAARGMLSSIDRVTEALEAMLNGTRPANGIQPLSGIRELYTLLSGDYEMTGRFNADRVYLANVTCSTMAGLVANALNKRVINEFQTYPKWWEPAVTMEDFATLQDIRWITLGGIGELNTISEGQAYNELTWDDNTETASFVKKGGYLGVTIEAIDKDDTRRLRAAPRALAQAAWLTLGKTIAALFTTNSGYGDTLADDAYIFHSDHGNLGTSTFSHAAYAATKIAMQKVTELNSDERLGGLIRPHLLWVPIDLEDSAIAELASGEGQIGSADYHVNPDAYSDSLTSRLQRAKARVITVPFWTDTADWVLQADPRLYPGLGLGFRYGRTPEIFSVASPTAGLMFTNDTMPIKVRYFFATGFTDYRAFYKHVVG